MDAGTMIDITRTLGEDTPVWPGDAPVKLVRDQWFETGPNVSSVCMSLHAGTHADLPLHYDSYGADAAGIDLSSFVGPCHVLELPEGQACVEEALFDGLPADTKRVLIKTPASALNGQAYIMSGYGLTPGAAQRIIDEGCLLVGVDGPSVGVHGEEGDAVHRMLLSHGVAVVEGLDLLNVGAGRYMLCCLPLKFSGAEGAPLRAVLFPVKEGV
ncbi:MAG: cyclase family protein [Bacillota bacterium]